MLDIGVKITLSSNSRWYNGMWQGMRHKTTDSNDTRNILLHSFSVLQFFFIVTEYEAEYAERNLVKTNMMSLKFRFFYYDAEML